MSGEGIKIYLSENYTDDLTDNKIALPCMGVCNCWRDRGTQKTQCCNYSPRWRPRYWLATRTPLGPEREVTSPRSELPVLTEAAAGGAARTQTAGERLRGPESLSRESMRSLGGDDLRRLLQEAAAIRSDRLSHDKYDETTWSARTWTTFAAQRISVALQRSAALEILQSLRMGPVEGRDLY